MLSKQKIIEKFGLTELQSKKIDQYIYEINAYNNDTNIVGKSTLIDPWKSHVLDSIQIGNFIQNKKSSILDMGCGAGMPGLILAISNFTNVSREQIEIESKYKSYLNRQHNDISDFKRDEQLALPNNIDYSKVGSLSNEVIEKLSKINPPTLGSAARISGVTPAAVIALLRHVKKNRNSTVN